VQIAVHDAVQAIDGRFEPYRYSDPAQLGAGSLAAAAAAHRALVLLYPARQAALDVTYGDYLLANSLAGDPGLAVGEAAAAAVHAAEYRPALPVEPFFGGTGPGNGVQRVPGCPWRSCSWRSAIPSRCCDRRSFARRRRPR
jgi:hypothetical protein